jgi:hypothetical protein
VRLSAVNQTDAITVSQFINFTPPEPLEAVHFGAWIKSMNVSWPSDRNLSVYINMYYPTGGATYGLANNGTPAPIDPGTYDWRFFEATVTPDSPLREVSLHVGMKNHTGTIWADDVELIKVYYLMKVGATQWKYLYTEPTSIPPTTMEGETQTPPTTAAGGFGLPLVFVAFIILFVIGFGRKILRRRK